jgi:hypothetical protein
VDPLDLTKAPPRSPREELRGLCMLPRMIDIARAKLPGGNVGEYQIGREKTFSAAILGLLKFSADEFVEIVSAAATDDKVAEHVLAALPVPAGIVSKRLRKITVADVPEERRSDFHRLYGDDLSPDRNVFDILEEDDKRMLGKQE